MLTQVQVGAVMGHTLVRNSGFPLMPYQRETSLCTESRAADGRNLARPMDGI